MLFPYFLLFSSLFLFSFFFFPYLPPLSECRPGRIAPLPSIGTPLLILLVLLYLLLHSCFSHATCRLTYKFPDSYKYAVFMTRVNVLLLLINFSQTFYSCVYLKHCVLLTWNSVCNVFNAIKAVIISSHYYCINTFLFGCRIQPNWFRVIKSLATRMPVQPSSPMTVKNPDWMERRYQLQLIFWTDWHQFWTGYWTFWLDQSAVFKP